MRPNLFSRSAPVAVAGGLFVLLALVVLALAPMAIDRWF